ncbi:MAG: hypothetical protein HY904_07880 [Deltaproteobacteria bacterium]|nr:hypothetical protein [Deltaproteobacteria bacterium]
MALPLPADPLPDLLGDIHYTAAWLDAHPEVASLAARLDGAHADIVGKATARNRAADGIVRGQAKREVAFRAVGEALVSLERKVDSHFDTDRKGYQAFFPVTPKAIIGSPISDRASAVEATLEAAAAKGLHKDVAPAAKKLVTAWDKYQGAVKNLVAAEKAYAKADAVVMAAKTKACATMRETHGHLETKYPEDRVFVESFFRKRVKRVAGAGKKKAPAETAEVPVNQPG